MTAGWGGGEGEGVQYSEAGAQGGRQRRRQRAQPLQPLRNQRCLACLGAAMLRPSPTSHAALRPSSAGEPPATAPHPSRRTRGSSSGSSGASGSSSSAQPPSNCHRLPLRRRHSGAPESPYTWSTGMSKYPTHCPLCRSMASTRSAPASVMMLALSLAAMASRPCREEARGGRAGRAAEAASGGRGRGADATRGYATGGCARLQLPRLAGPAGRVALPSSRRCRRGTPLQGSRPWLPLRLRGA